jgi:hypothetical protein
LSINNPALKGRGCCSYEVLNPSTRITAFYGLFGGKFEKDGRRKDGTLSNYEPLASGNLSNNGRIRQKGEKNTNRSVIDCLSRDEFLLSAGYSRNIFATSKYKQRKDNT